MIARLAGALVENKVLALLHRYGIAAPASADLARAVVMSFSAAAVWRIRRAAPMLPTVLLGDTSRYLGGSAATTVGATAVGPSITTLREHPELVDHAAAHMLERPRIAGREFLSDARAHVEYIGQQGFCMARFKHMAADQRIHLLKGQRRVIRPEGVNQHAVNDIDHIFAGIFARDNRLGIFLFDHVTNLSDDFMAR